MRIITVIWILLSSFSIVRCLVPSSEIRIIHGQRCLIAPAQEKDDLFPTLVLVGGMAQTLKSWEHHLPALSKNRKVIVYECAGQGASISNLQNVSLPFQAEKLLETLDVLLENPVDRIDLVGFSFGGRVGMATACLKPERIRKLHLTGVAVDRSDYGHLAIEAWKDCIRSDDSLRSFAWSVLLATYSSTFLRSQPIERYLDHICENNSPEGLLALLTQAEVSDMEDPWHVVNMADRLDKSVQGKLCVGGLDQMAPPEDGQRLCEQLGWLEPTIVPNCAHAVGLEAARVWRNDVLSFLNE
jgi:pimeloyl-ACP methyl ester carboxylesterase